MSRARFNPQANGRHVARIVSPIWVAFFTLSIALSVAFVAILLSGCGGPPHRQQSPAGASVAPADALFVDVAARAGIRFTHTNGATGNYYFIENTPSGCAFFDYDNDGFLDILLIQSGSSRPPAKATYRPHCALYHNNGNGTFTDVTAGSGLDKDLGYAQGVAVGDYDNDGYDDLFITGYGGNHLFHNEKGTGKFTDATHRMGLDSLHSTGYATSAAFGDYDNDGKLDLYVCYYAPWTWEKDAHCQDAKQRQDYCSPEVYDSDTHQLFHNAGNRFVDVSEKAGITKIKSHGLAVAFLDYDDDGRQDIFVANDRQPNLLWHNNGNGTFTNVAVATGVAYSEGGGLMAGMGVAIADYDHSGQESLFVSNFSGMPNALFKAAGHGVFHDMSSASGLMLPHLPFLAFGCAFLDYDNDGWPDLIVANGHVASHLDAAVDGIGYKERKQLFHNEGNGTFTEIVSPGQLGDLSTPMVARGLAIGDLDNDGKVDVLVNNQNGPAQLFHNQARNANRWVAFKTIGTKSNRDGLHTRFVLTAGGVKQLATVRTGFSYLSASDRRVYFGLGAATRIDRVAIRWPSGATEVLTDLAPNAIYVVTEGKGVTGKDPGPK